jgi:hypothetical protein
MVRADFVKERTVWLTYEKSEDGDLLPTLWDDPVPNGVKAIWRDTGGHITLESVE